MVCVLRNVVAFWLTNCQPNHDMRAVVAKSPSTSRSDLHARLTGVLACSRPSVGVVCCRFRRGASPTTKFPFFHLPPRLTHPARSRTHPPRLQSISGFHWEVLVVLCWWDEVHGPHTSAKHTDSERRQHQRDGSVTGGLCLQAQRSPSISAVVGCCAASSGFAAVQLVASHGSLDQLLRQRPLFYLQ